MHIRNCKLSGNLLYQNIHLHSRHIRLTVRLWKLKLVTLSDSNLCVHHFNYLIMKCYFNQAQMYMHQTREIMQHSIVQTTHIIRCSSLGMDDSLPNLDKVNQERRNKRSKLMNQLADFYDLLKEIFGRKKHNIRSCYMGVTWTWKCNKSRRYKTKSIQGVRIFFCFCSTRG